MQKILIVIDMQNDFVTGSLGSEAAQVAAKNIAAHINEYDTVIFTRDTHGPRLSGYIRRKVPTGSALY